MRLIMTLLVRDEADIIRQNVAFHLEQGVDFILVTDNGSVDGTRDILEDLSRTGPVRVIDEPSRDFAQGQWVSRMALLARGQHAADWILNSDADEFWRASSGDLKSTLAGTPPEADVIVCPRRHMLFPSNQRSRGPWHRNSLYRVAHPVPLPSLRDRLTDPLPAPYFYLDLPPKVLCRAHGLKAVHEGNHWADYEAEVRPASGSVHVYHFPVRSFAQFVRKVRAGGAAYARNTVLSPSVGWHWRRWHRMLVDGDIERALGEALPSEARLLRDLGVGSVLIDRTMTDDLERLSGEQPVTPVSEVRSSRAGQVRTGDQDPVEGSAVCVLGMHRSGTSVLARVLNLLGVDLGPSHCLMSPDPNNPGGYWEHQGLVDINDAILRRFGGSWDRPPVFPFGWERSEGLADLRASARELLRDTFADAALWGWKDPRTCLTLPFWQSLLPPMRHVIALRSPLSVARSLERRDGLSMEESGRLWLRYVTSALMHTQGRARVIVPYERLLAEPGRDARRLADFIGRSAGLTPEIREVIETAVRPDLCHHGASLQKTLGNATLPFSASALYAMLCLLLHDEGVAIEEEDPVDVAVSAVQRATRMADGKDVAFRQLQEEHSMLAAAHQKRGDTVAQLSGHPVWRGYLRLRRATIPPGSRREAGLKVAWRWLRARSPEQG